MPRGPTALVSRLFAEGTAAGLTDAQLLDRFATGRAEASASSLAAEAAFAALVARHGPMVLGVCRRALTDPNDVDDAFQAVFLVLVRRAHRVRIGSGDSLGRWLYGVSRRVAARARSRAERRRSELSPPESIDDRPSSSFLPEARLALREALDAELAGLPSKYRDPVVLCHLEGLTHEEAARRLAWPVGTLSGRISRARVLLRDRLTRRGLAPAAVAPMLAALACGRARAAVPALLANSTVQAATAPALAAPRAALAGSVPASATALAEGVLRAMTLTRLKLAASALLALGLAATGAVVLAQGEAPGAGRGPDDEPRTTSSRVAVASPTGWPQTWSISRAADCTVCHVASELTSPHDPFARRARGFVTGPRPNDPLRDQVVAAHGHEARERLRDQLGRLDRQIDQLREALLSAESNRRTVARQFELLQQIRHPEIVGEDAPAAPEPARPPAAEADRLRELERKLDLILERLGESGPRPAGGPPPGVEPSWQEGRGPVHR